jgi:hypothetical protein
MELESACAACFVSAQPESNDQTDMKITNARASTFSISIFLMRKSICTGIADPGPRRLSPIACFRLRGGSEMDR